MQLYRKFFSRSRWRSPANLQNPQFPLYAPVPSSRVQTWRSKARTNTPTGLAIRPPHRATAVGASVTLDLCVSSGTQFVASAVKKGHISTACRSVSTNTIVQQSTEGNDSHKSTQVVLHLDSSNDNLWRETCMLFDKPVEFLIDTGSQVTLIPCTIARSLDAQASLQGIIVRAYGRRHSAHLRGSQSCHYFSRWAQSRGSRPDCK